MRTNADQFEWRRSTALGLLVFSTVSCTSGSKAEPEAQSPPTSSSPRVGIYAENTPQGVRFYFQYVGTKQPGEVGAMIVVTGPDRGLENPVCVVVREQMPCRGSTWYYGEVPRGWRLPRDSPVCEPLEVGTVYNVQVDGNMGNRNFKLREDGTVAVLDGLGEFEPPTGPRDAAERERYRWTCERKYKDVD
jgi:hypothetical protein